MSGWEDNGEKREVIKKKERKKEREEYVLL